MKPSTVLIAACFFAASPYCAANEASLYDRIGGETVMQRVVEQMMIRMANDPQVNQSFAGIDVHKLSVKVARHFCAITGGGCTPADDSVKVIHAGLDIDERQFHAIVESLRIALDTNDSGERGKNQLLRVLAPAKRDVVTR